MGMVAPSQRIASSYVVFFGVYGEVTRQAHERGISRQAIYRQATATVAVLEGAAQGREVEDGLREQVRQLRARVAELEGDRSRSVVLTSALQGQFAAVGVAQGVSLPALRALLEVLKPGEALSVAHLGRLTKAAGKRSGELLPVLDECTRALARQASLDEIYVKAPVLMVVEPDSLCWLTGQMTDAVTGAAWVEPLATFPALEQATRDAGCALKSGVAQLNARRREQGLSAVADQLDHFHTVFEGNKARGRGERRLRRALEKAETQQKEVDHKRQQGESVVGLTTKANRLWAAAEREMDQAMAVDQAWQKTQAALRLFTPAGELNTRTQATAVLAETLPQLPDADFAKTKRLLQQPETLTYLDEVQRKLAAVPAPAAVKQAAVRIEGLRRHPELLRGDSPSAAALRGVLLAYTVVLAKAEEVGAQTLEDVRKIFRTTWRASSLVEGVNSVLRMHQARHRKLTQGLVDLKRLYWNCHVFRTGRRKNQTPYQRLGLPWPDGLAWWDLLKMTPEQLRDKLSALNKAK